MDNGDYFLMEESTGGTKKITRANALTPVSIGQGGTGATTYQGARNAFGLKYGYLNTSKTLTLPAGYRGILFLASAFQACVGIYRVMSSAAGATSAISIVSASGATITGGTGTLTIAMTNATEALLLDISGESTWN